ncbi:reticulon-4-interacting protein [Xylariales sp. PMI_506]|nr:reticulon-4-interacting protein [Xylariales sp. PMI_506]
MRLYQIPAPGPFFQQLTLATVSRPREPLDDGQILIQVAVAGLNPLDYKLAEAGLISKVQFSFPKCPGMDFSGRVIAVGPNTPNVKPGDNVMGRMPPFKASGSLAEYVVASPSDIAVIPGNVTLEQAGGAATCALTAYQTMVPFVKPGDKIFINGGSGGTGTWAIQIAKAIGCHVTASCSTSKVDLCRQLGADEVIDYKTTDVNTWLHQCGKVFAVAVDNVGTSNLFSFADEFLAPGGRFRLVGSPKSVGGAMNLVFNKVSSTLLPTFLGGSDHKFDAFVTKNVPTDLAQIASWMGEGKVKTIIDSVFSFEDAPKAFEKLKEGSSTGKILVNIQGNAGEAK